MSLKKKSWLLLLILFLLIIIILPGCISATYETKIDADGSGQRVQDLAIDESFAGLLESSNTSKGKKGFEDELKANMPKDAEYKKFTTEGKVHHRITFNFKDMDELNRISKNLNKDSDIPNAAEAKMLKHDYVVFANYRFTDAFPSGSKSKLELEEEQIAKAVSVTYKLTLPGTITDAEKTDEVEGSTAIWHINPSKGGKIEATSRYIRWWLVIVLLAAVIFISIISAILIFLGLRKKKPEPSKPAQTPEEPAKKNSD